MAIRVLKITRVTTPKCVLRGTGNYGTGVSGFLHDRINFFFTVYVMTDCEFSSALWSFWNLCIIGEIVASPNRKLHAGLQIKKGNDTMLKFSANDSLCR